jgi:hypothetical protein
MCGIVSAVFLFPVGILCLLLDRKRVRWLLLESSTFDVLWWSHIAILFLALYKMRLRAERIIGRHSFPLFNLVLSLPFTHIALLYLVTPCDFFFSAVIVREYYIYTVVPISFFGYPFCQKSRRQL